MITFQDFEKRTNSTEEFLQEAITQHQSSELYKTALVADLYDKQRNKTINEYVRMIFTLTGASIEDFTASNAKVASNFFHRLNTQRCTYSLGNGVTFEQDSTEKRLGPMFDNDLFDAGYKSLIHAVAFCYWNVDRMHVFPVTQFVPMWDELTGALRAGIRFWQLDDDKPMVAVLYEEDGYTKYVTNKSNKFEIAQTKKKYRQKSRVTSGGEEEIIGEENYSVLPIVPLWGSKLHQSTLVGMQQGIDTFDLIRSGFANDLSDCSQIYWLIENCGGMTDNQLAQVRDRMKLTHMLPVDTDGGGKITPFVQEIPYQARMEYLKHIREGIYEDFGGLDVHTVAAGATNDHIDAAYQPMDENADDFELQIIGAVKQLLALLGIDDTPIFKRNRISNQREQVEIVMMESEYLDEETILSKLPNITPDEIAGILAKREAEGASRYEIPERKEDEEEVIVE